MNRTYALKFNNGADFWRVYDGDTGFCISEHNSNNAARKKVKKLNKRMKLAEEKDNMDKLTYSDFEKAKKYLEAAKVPEPVFYFQDELIYTQPCVPPISFGCCKPAPTPVPTHYDPIYGYSKCNPARQQEQGNNPMRYETNTAVANIAAVKSDEAFQREYLLEELEKNTRSWSDPVRTRLVALFNLHADNTPKSAKQLIDAITGGKFKLDEKKAAKGEAYANGTYDEYDDDCDCEYPTGMFYGLTFDGPQPDPKGYDAAVKDYEQAIKDTKRTIIVKSPADGLDALTALESWQPTGKAN